MARNLKQLFFSWLLLFHPIVSDMDSSISEYGNIHCCKKGFSQKISNRMADSVDSDKTARYEPSHLYLHCLQRYLYLSMGMKELKQKEAE